MSKKETLPAVSMELYRQLVFDVAAHLSDGSWDKNQAVNYLIDLANRPVKDDPHPQADQTAQAKKLTCTACRNCMLGQDSEKKPALVCGGKHQEIFSLEEDHTSACPSFTSRYIQYPFQVNEIDSGGDWTKYLRDQAALVEVRPAGDKKTYLGFLLGDFPMSAAVTYNQKTKALKVLPFANPAIFVPELGKIIFGCESWWRRIESVKDAKEITDKDIENTWYVQMLREMEGEEKK